MALEIRLSSTCTLCHSVENPGSGSQALCSPTLLMLAIAQAVTDELSHNGQVKVNMVVKLDSVLSI